jgi:hypothetical protein
MAVHLSFTRLINSSNVTSTLSSANIFALDQSRLPSRPNHTLYDKEGARRTVRGGSRCCVRILPSRIEVGMPSRVEKNGNCDYKLTEYLIL